MLLSEKEFFEKMDTLREEFGAKAPRQDFIKSYWDKYGDVNPYFNLYIQNIGIKFTKDEIYRRYLNDNKIEFRDELIDQIIFDSIK